MTNNIELHLNSDNQKSFSSNSNDNDSIIKELDIETEEEKKDRISLQNALQSNNNERAFEIINSKITSFCSKLQILQDYSLCLGSKSDNKQKGEDIEKLILEASDEISETFKLIEIIQNFEYKEKNQKIQNINKANNLYDKCNNYEQKFNDLINKIKKQNLNLIKQVRNSRRFSNFSDFSGEINLDYNKTPKKNTSNEYNTDKKYLEDIEIKKKQNNAIYKATRKMEHSLSRRQTSVRINNDNNENLENINIDNNYRKMSNNESKELSSSNFSKKNSAFIHDMERKVFIALEGQKPSFIRRHWLFIILFILLLIGIIYYIFCKNEK